jgi:hypothetical protein
MKLSLFTILSNSLVPPKYARVNCPGIFTISELKLIHISFSLLSAVCFERTVVLCAL